MRKLLESNAKEVLHLKKTVETVTSMDSQATAEDSMLEFEAKLKNVAKDRAKEKEERLRRMMGGYANKYENIAEQAKNSFVENETSLDESMGNIANISVDYDNILSPRGERNSSTAQSNQQNFDVEVEDLRNELNAAKRKIKRLQEETEEKDEELTQHKISAQTRQLELARIQSELQRKDVELDQAVGQLNSRDGELKQLFFFALAVGIKLNMAMRGQTCNVDLMNMYEKAKDIDFRQWNVWIHEQFQRNSTPVQSPSLARKKNQDLTNSFENIANENN